MAIVTGHLLASTAVLAVAGALAACGSPESTPAAGPGEPSLPSTSVAGDETVSGPQTAGEPEPGSGRPRGTRAVVASVTDGDTILLASGRRVRLVQIDAPEPSEGECYGAEATAELESLLPPGTRVRLVADPRLDRVDDYGRLLRYVFADGRNVNVALVRRGAATVWLYGGERGVYAAKLLRVARQAQAAGRGLWGACPGTPFDPLHGADTGIQRPAEGSGPALSCPGAIPWHEAASHAGERATVEGPVVGTHYAADTSGQPTFLNLGVDYPDERRFTALIWGESRGAFPGPPERAYAGRTICVRGTIELYRGVAEIEVRSPEQIAVVG